jgi:hypothetical protein
MECEIARVMREDKLRRPAAIKRLAKRSSIDPQSILKKLYRKPRFSRP